MNTDMLKEAVILSGKTGHVILATADAKGLPHIACAKKMELVSGDEIAVTEWFCPGTVRNLQENTRIALMVWDSRRDQGYQLFGKSENVEDTAIMDGYAAEESVEPPLPQVKIRLLLRVDKIIEFKHAPHSDEEERPLRRPFLPPRK